MQNYLQNYQMQITALSPIHIGDGSSLSKKEYIQTGFQKPVKVPDLSKMFQDLTMMNKDTAFASFMLGNSRDGLGQWLVQQHIDPKKIDSWTRYQMDAGDAFLKAANGKTANPHGIMCFTKDAYGNPYIPGSSIKGMIRTALLAKEMRENPDDYADLLENLYESAKRGGKRNSYLQRETRALETKAFHVSNEEDAVNSVLRGLIVSDSEAMDVKQLILTQKIDYSLDGKEKPIPTLREALAPGTKIRFSLTIDSTICPYGIDDILTALDDFQTDCYQYFYRRFRRGSQEKGIVWLGGGCGFLSKTILYPAFEERGVYVTDTVFHTSLGKKYEEHKHSRDIGLRIAPHVCKCTRYHGKLYDMGMGKLEVIS